LAADRTKLKIEEERLNEINEFMLGKDNPLTSGLLAIIDTAVPRRSTERPGKHASWKT
jgi:hypothetical protein